MEKVAKDAAGANAEALEIDPTRTSRRMEVCCMHLQAQGVCPLNEGRDKKIRATKSKTLKVDR